MSIIHYVKEILDAFTAPRRDMVSGTLVLFYRAQMALSTTKPLVLRINDIGRAEAVDYQNFAHKPQEAESRYFLSEWARDYYGRNHYTVQKDFTKAFTS